MFVKIKSVKLVSLQKYIYYLENSVLEINYNICK